ncbi:MAG: hypothetical protein ACI33S_03180 [Bacilli bacterium]
MKNKVLTEIYLSGLDEKFNVYLPLNKNIANIIELTCKAISEYKRITNIDYKKLSLYNHDTALKYSPDLLIRDSNIRNGTRLILM